MPSRPWRHELDYGMSHRTPFGSTARAVVLAVAACACSGPSPSSAPSTPDAAPYTPGPVETAKASLARLPASSVPATAVSAAVAANNAFAVDLYARLRSGAAGADNLLTSPLSASLALTMTYAGAKGSTASGMAAALHLGSGASSIFEGQNALDQDLASRAAYALAGDQQTASENGQPAPSPADYDLTVVNSVWGEKTYPWAAPFLDILATDYGTGVYLDDFIHQFDDARQDINAWVSDQTADRITDLLPPGSLDDTTRMVLVNAIHLKLPWAYPFSVAATAPATFTRADGTKVTTPFMNQAQTLWYVDDGQAQIVGLPLSGGQEAVVIALPHGDLASYEASLTAGSSALTQPGSVALVGLSLPKLSFTSPSLSLMSALQAMGMAQAFDRDSADFTGLCSQTPDHDRLYIHDALQKAMLGMQETGVEAAAATAVVVDGQAECACPPPPPIPMVVDRPFLVSIVDVPTGAVLFLGHIEDPTQTGSD